MASPNSQTFRSGPFNGVRLTAEPSDEVPNLLHRAVNFTFPDVEAGCGAYSRPGFQMVEADWIVSAVGPATTVSRIQGAHCHIGTDGSAFRFVVVDGRIWQQNGEGAYTNVTPTNVYIDPDVNVYFTSLGDTMVLTDGTVTPVALTGMAATPATLTATMIPLSTAQVRLFYDAGAPTKASTLSFPFNIQGTFGSQGSAAVTLTAGSIPLNTWGAFVVSMTAVNTFVVTPAAANFTTGYATEALAIAAAGVAAFPLANTRWYVGMVTIQAPIGAAFVVNTADLATAQDYNFYEGSPAPWTAYGKPVIYTGSVFFVLNNVPESNFAVPITSYTMVTARSAIAWSEPNFPLVGYQQTDYDNLWELTQTGSQPLYALAATNDALYYSRALGWGALSGTPNINFQNTATHDVVSGNIGCTSPNTVQVFRDTVYFCDANGRPWRFRVGGSPEPIWHQQRQWFLANRAEYTQDHVEFNWWGIIEPNLNEYWWSAGRTPVGGISSVTTGYYNIQAFDATTGLYVGERVPQVAPIAELVVPGSGINAVVPVDVAAVYTYAETTPTIVSNGTHLVAWSLMSSALNVATAVGPLLSVDQDNLWNDEPFGPIWTLVSIAEQFRVPLQLVTQWLGYGMTANTKFTEARTVVWNSRYDSADTTTLPAVTIGVDTTQTQGTVASPSPSGGGVSSTNANVLYSGNRYQAMLDRTRMGRGGRVVLTTYTEDDNLATGQVVVWGVEADAVMSETTVRDR